MPESPGTPEDPGSPLTWASGAIRGGWNDLLSIYYANTTIWRLLKSGGLIFFGFFCWTGANLLLSYRPDWGFLYYVMSYGFVLILWGPLTHFVIVPTIIRFRRSGASGIKRFLSRHGSKANLSIFLAIVVILGTFPLGVMTFEFQVPVGVGGDEVNAQLECTASSGVIHCHITDARGIDSVVITSGEETMQELESGPYAFDLHESDLQTVNGDRQFTVELRDENGDTIRRYIRRADLIPGGSNE
jgi:hypothetical protein